MEHDMHSSKGGTYLYITYPYFNQGPNPPLPQDVSHEEKPSHPTTKKFRKYKI